MLSAIGVALLAACGPSLSDELAPAAAGDTGCHELPEAVHARYPEVARTLALELHDTLRTLTIGVDSANRVRRFASGVHARYGTQLTVRVSAASIDEDGTMSKATRSVTTGDVESRNTTSNETPLSADDTARVRALAAEAARRCVR
jgi:hypothetical protein